MATLSCSSWSRTQCFVQVVSSWPWDKSPALSEWLSLQHDYEMTDYLKAQMVQRFFASDLNQATDWASKITDEQVKLKSFKNIYYQIAKQDKALAKEFIINSEFLREEVKKQILYK